MHDKETLKKIVDLIIKIAPPEKAQNYQVMMALLELGEDNAESMKEFLIKSLFTSIEIMSSGQQVALIKTMAENYGCSVETIFMTEGSDAKH